MKCLVYILTVVSINIGTLPPDQDPTQGIGKNLALLRGMDHSCEYLCSELVTVMFEDQPGELCQVTANLEEISNTSVTVLMEDKPRLGAPISLTVKGRDLFGLVSSRLRYTTIGWFATITLDPDCTWRREWFSPKHLLGMCLHCANEAALAKVTTLDMPRVTEENRLASFLSMGA